MGDSNITVDVPPGQVVDVTWNAPWLVFLMGKITATGPRPLAPADTAAAQQAVAQPTPQIQQAAAGGTAPAPAAAQPADWYPDPRSRHQLRYWDGNAWTDNVSDNGVTLNRPGVTLA
jgi:hypothetical protein